MAMVNFVELTSDKLSRLNVKKGQLIYCVDTKETFYDTLSGAREQMTDVVYLKTEAEKNSLLAPVTGKLYCIRESNQLYMHDGTNWKHLSPYVTSDGTFNTSTTKAGTFTIDGVPYAPKTLTNAVYENGTGKLLSDLLKALGDDIAKVNKDLNDKIDTKSTVAKSTTNGNILLDDAQTVVYTHPTTAGNKHIPAGGATGQVLKYSASGTAVWADEKDTVYTHPTHTANAAGLYKIATNNLGHVTEATAVEKADITALGIPEKDTVYTHPTTAGNKHIPTGGAAGQILKYSASGTAVWADEKDTVYTHPTHTANASGLYKITTDTLGHVTAATKIAKADITGLGIPGQDTVYTHPAHTANESGLYKIATNALGHVTAVDPVVKADITALGIPASDTKYTHPTTAGNKHIPAGGAANQILKWSADGTAVWAAEKDTTYAVANSTTPGLVKSGSGISVATDGTVTVVNDSHTHTIAKITNLQNTLDSKLNTALKGANNGLAELDAAGKVPASQLPSYVDDVIEGYFYNSKFYTTSAHTTEITPEAGKVYTDLGGSNKTYRWGGTAYVLIASDLALGETSATAYRGDRGKIAYDHSQAAHARTDATLTQASTTNGNIKINGTETKVYTHPTATAKASGLYKVTVDATGHVTSTAAVAKTDITGLGIPAQDTVYTHPTHTANASGLYKITTDTLGHVTAATKVAKADITGLGIPAQDTVYTHPATAGNKHIPAGGAANQILKWSEDGTAVWAAEKDTVYTHPTTAGNKHIPAGGAANQILKWSADGTAVWAAEKDTVYTHPTATAYASGLYKITTNNLGHVTAAAAVTKTDITGLGIPASDTVYTHPTTTGNKHIPSGGASGQILKWSSDGTAVWAAEKDTTYSVATQSANGLMSATDKKKLDGSLTYVEVTASDEFVF